MSPPAPHDPALKMAKTIKMMVEMSRDHLRDQLSLRYPKKSCPRTVPAKAIDETLDLAEDVVYCVG